MSWILSKKSSKFSDSKTDAAVFVLAAMVW